MPPQATATLSPQPSHGAGLFSLPIWSHGSPGPSSWLTHSREEKPRDGSPKDVIVQCSTAVPDDARRVSSHNSRRLRITLPPPREVVWPEMPRDSAPATGRVDEEEWVTFLGM